MNEPTGDATMKTHSAKVVERDNSKSTVVVETSHPEPQCKRITLTTNQCKGGLPGLFTQGRVYMRVVDGGVIWFFRPLDKR